MDVIATLREGISELPVGAHTAGLNAVLSHIEIAYKHFRRAEKEGEDELYTDAIYRCNQAFEGSLKEAYRVLTKSDPAKLTVFQIEKKLDENSIFTGRSLNLFRNYRQDWRNPSTHDYTIGFDQAESFLAIMSITGFAKVLINLIGVRISSELAGNAIKSQPLSPKPNLDGKEEDKEDLTDQVANALAEARSRGILRHDKLASESQAIGTISGILSAKFQHFKMVVGEPLAADKRYRPDIVMSNDSAAIIVEVKYGSGQSTVWRGYQQVESYLKASKISNGLLYVITPSSSAELKTYPLGGDENEDILIITTELEDSDFIAYEDPMPETLAANPTAET